MRKPHAQAAVSERAAQQCNPHRHISAAAVRDICGGISDMSLWRWLNDPVLNFPKPIRIGKRRYWREAELAAWLDAQADKSREAAA
jgi:predicted DNA-binding transcriptional regulator AlpA